MACKRRIETGHITMISAEIIGGKCAKIYPNEDTGGRHVERFTKAPSITVDC